MNKKQLKNYNIKDNKKIFFQTGLLEKLLKNNLSRWGFFITLAVIFIALFAPFISPYNPEEINTANILMPPSFEHFMGTDALGRDCFSRLIFGARISLLVGFVAVGISTMIGILLGSISGFYGKLTDAIIMRLVDIMLCFPAIFLIMAVIAFLEPSIYNIMAIIGLTSWMGVARLVRAEFLTLKTRDFVLASRIAGASDKRIIFSHILPNALSPVIVTATLGIGSAILTESALSFLGIGVQLPTPSWGNMLTEGKDNIEIAWWLSFYPGIAILVTVLGFNLLGEGLRDIFDPRTRKR